jgi:glycosyltransferase involved in cell wall biosynthesis
MSEHDHARRPKVLIAMEPLFGGTLQHLEYLLAWLDPSEFEVHLAVSAERDPGVRGRFARWEAAGRRVHEVPMRRELAPLRDLRALVRLVRLCRRERFDLVHTHCAKAGFLGRLAARLSGSRVLHTPHVFPFDRGGSRAAEALYLALERLAARWTDRMVLLSRYQVNQVLRRHILPLERVSVVPNGVDAARFRPGDRTAARRALGLPADGPVALMLGRFCHQKGQDVLLAALRRLGAAAPLTVLVGSGPQAESVRQGLRGLSGTCAVRVEGETDRPELWYAACDLVVMPSRYEGMPYVLLEAKSAGRPVAVSLVSGMEEFVRQGVDGFLLPPGDAEALAAVLGGLARAPQGCRAMGGEPGGLRAEWTAERSARRVAGLYRALTGR